MNPESVLSYITLENPEGSAIENLRKAKEMFESNSSEKFTLSNRDLNFLEIFHIMNLSQREKDIVFISEFFHEAYYNYNKQVLLLGKKLSNMEIDRLIQVYQRLKTYNLLKFLFEDGEVVDFKLFKKQINL
jgi:hypothetical protein